jgi:hypothetical protein
MMALMVAPFALPVGVFDNVRVLPPVYVAMYVLPGRLSWYTGMPWKITPDVTVTLLTVVLVFERFPVNVLLDMMVPAPADMVPVIVTPF